VFALEQAVKQLTAMDPALGQLVELRFYAGLDLTEIAEITERSERSLKRDWRKARAFLHAVLGSDEHGQTQPQTEGSEEEQPERPQP
jgi:DNA-directed RNA polymerase specialized sigma24 family protein